MRNNCWEHKKCGREPGGSQVDELGVCAAASTEEADGINSGKNGGRCCWIITGTLCGGKVQGVFAQKLTNCLECDFFKIVKQEEGEKFWQAKTILDHLKKDKSE